MLRRGDFGIRLWNHWHPVHEIYRVFANADDIE